MGGVGEQLLSMATEVEGHGPTKTMHTTDNYLTVEADIVLLYFLYHNKLFQQNSAAPFGYHPKIMLYGIILK